MKLGFGLYRHLLTPTNYRFARQAGATHIVAHLVGYFDDGTPDGRGTALASTAAQGHGWGITTPKPIWSVPELVGLRREMEAEGLSFHAIENIDPAFWYDVLLDGPRRDDQLEDVCRLIRNIGAAGIPVLGYNFTMTNCWGQVMGPFARGGAEAWGYGPSISPAEYPIPHGQVWNMTYDLDAPPGDIGTVDRETLFDRYRRFLAVVLPEAERAGVQLAIHPDDPPVPELRGTARMSHSPDSYQSVLDLSDSPSHALEFCQGTVSEMPDHDIYETITRFARQGRIAYVHFRNVVGRAPDYREVFVDEGYVDMARAMRAYRDAGYDGVFVPDHSPQMSCPAPWHAGMAFAMGYMRGVMQSVADG